jgi:hypothetical protein
VVGIARRPQWRPIAATAFVAVALAGLLASAAVTARPAPDLAVTRVKGVPKKALTGDKLQLKVTVANEGKAKSRPSKVTARLGPEIGSPLPDVVGRGRVGALAPGRSNTVRFRATIPGGALGVSELTACVPPRKESDCEASSRVQVGDGSSSALIEAARAKGKLTPGKADLYGLYALTGDRRLPRAYRGGGPLADAEVFTQIVADWPSLSAAEQGALLPYLLQPRYRQSAWAPSRKGKAGPGASASGAGAPSGGCGGLDRIQGAWNGIQSAHAWFWYRPGSSSGRANARRLANEFDAKIWPKLTGAFKEVGDAAAAPCDPAGDSKIDVYLGNPGAFRAGAEGVAPPVPVQNGPACGPFPSFVVINEGEDRWTLAHEFMHVIQWAYAACNRDSAWVEGTASWAGDFVYPRDQEEHESTNGILLPYQTMLDSDYHAWTFWYSVAKKSGAAGIKRFLEALAGTDFAGALAALPDGGLREAWKRYAVERWNQTPIGSPGFPVRQSFKDNSWDSFRTKPGGVSEEDISLPGGLTERTFDVKTYGPGGLGDPSKDLGPLSTSFSHVKISHRRVRELRFKNGSPGGLVQAFLKLKNGRWRLEDWSNLGTVTLCRDEPDQNVTELVIATSNPSARGGSLGRKTHELRARSHCEQAPVTGTFSGTESYATDDGQVTMNFRFNGSLTLTPQGQNNPSGVFGSHWPDEPWDLYHVSSGSYTLSGGGTSYGCTVELISASYTLAPQSSAVTDVMVIEPGEEPRYGLTIYPSQEQPQARFQCPGSDVFTGTFSQPAYLIYTPDPEQTMQRRIYQGSSTVTEPGGGGSSSGTYSWNLSGG